MRKAWPVIKWWLESALITFAVWAGFSLLVIALSF